MPSEPTTADNIYGLEWGDPERDEHLMYVKGTLFSPYVTPKMTALEIGPGGRWTRYLLAARMVYAVDYHQELLDELAVNFRADNLISIKNSGTDLEFRRRASTSSSRSASSCIWTLI